MFSNKKGKKLGSRDTWKIRFHIFYVNVGVALAAAEILKRERKLGSTKIGIQIIGMRVLSDNHNTRELATWKTGT